MTVSYFL